MKVLVNGNKDFGATILALMCIAAKFEKYDFLKTLIIDFSL